MQVFGAGAGSLRYIGSDGNKKETAFTFASFRSQAGSPWRQLDPLAVAESTAVRLADTPPPQSATLGLHPLAHRPHRLLVSHTLKVDLVGYSNLLKISLQMIRGKIQTV